jgi:F420-0:gamma-glutamyl ligase
MKLLVSIIIILSTVCSHAENAIEEKPPEFIRKIVAIKIPTVASEDATLSELIDFIAHRIGEIDPRKPGGISFLTSGFKNNNDGDDQPVDPKVGVKRVNYSANDVRVDEVLTDLARLFYVEFHVTSVGVVVTPTGTRPFPNAKADKGDVYYTYKSKPGDGRDDGDKPPN